MPRTFLCAWLLVGISTATAHGQAPKVIAKDLNKPTAVAVGADGRTYVATPDGLRVVVDGKGVPFAEDGPKQPRSLVAFRDALFVVEPEKGIWRVDLKGKGVLHVALADFPDTIVAVTKQLEGIAVDPENGTLYVGVRHARIYRIDPKKAISLVTDTRKSDLMHVAGLAMDGASFLIAADGATGKLFRVAIAGGSARALAESGEPAAGLAWDRHGRLFATTASGSMRVVARPDTKPRPLDVGFRVAGYPCVDVSGQNILVPDEAAGTITAVPAQVPGEPVDTSPMPLECTVAFPKLQWAGWEGETDTGLTVPLRPVVLTHANDGSNRVFVATQHGVIHAFPNDQAATATKVFLDIQDRVRYNDKENEEGFLGLAFHPRYKETGELFVLYTERKGKHTNVLSRFRVRKDNPDQADPTSEEVLLRIERPFWNHDGGTLCFGPDGYLYVALGDGGAFNDPFDNGQNLKTLLGKVLRLDIDRKDDGKPYAIPKDNPFVGKEGAAPETWAYGLRNVWRMAFDRGTGKLWAADVGQNLFEEINILKAGGNFGWRRREGLHPFGPQGKPAGPDFIDPIWEYNHDVGKSITGGVVYRGQRLPELQGHYLYGDYISTKLWALKYDEKEGRVVANRPLTSRGLAILSFGEDEPGDVYFLTYSATGHGIHRFTRPATAPSAEIAAAKAIAITEDVRKKLPRRQVKLPDSGEKPVVYEGVALVDLLKEAGVATGKELKGEALAQYLLVEAADGYRVVLSLPELDDVILADRRNGGGLDPQEGPLRLVVPHDGRHSRWVRGVTRVTVQGVGR